MQLEIRKETYGKTQIKKTLQSNGRDLKGGEIVGKNSKVWTVV